MPYEKKGSITVTFQDGTEHEFTSIEKCAGLDPADVVEVNEVEPDLSLTSTMPVQNKTVTGALNDKADLEDGKVPSSQLPSYVDDVVEYPTLNDFPATGEQGKIYLALDTGFTYRWSGSTYVRVNEPDLSNYYTKGQTDNLLSAKQNNITVTSVPDGDVAKVIGFDTSNALKKEAVLTFSAQEVYDFLSESGRIEQLAPYVVDPAAFFVTPSYITIDGVAYPVIDDTDAEVAEILGSTVVWNQHVRNGNFANTDYWTAENSAFSVSSNVATFTASSQYGNIKQNLYGLKGGHKYALFAMVKTTTATDRVAINLFRNLNHQVFTAASTSWQALSSLIEIEADGNGVLYIIDNRAADWDAVQVRDVVIVDVTAAIPTDTPTSVDDDRVQQLIQYALANPAYAENALLDFKIDSITSRGFNQWSEEWEAGSIDPSTGENASMSNAIRSKGYIRVIPGETYYRYSVNNNLFVVLGYDANKNFIRRLINYGANGSFSVTQDISYIRFFIDPYGAAYNNDICINVSNASLNGQHKPYRESSIDWESIIPDDEDRTARSAGAARDVIYVRDDGNDTFSIVKRKVIGSTDMGSLTWSISDGMLRARLTSATDSNILCAKYKTGVYDTLQNGQICNATFNFYNIIVKDPTYNDPAVFKSDMSGEPLYYKLANPEEIVLASGLLYDQVSFLIERGGTIAINGGMPDALPGIEIDIPVKKI